MANDGKKFENLVVDSCKRQGILCQRLKDTASFQKGNKNEADVSFTLFGDQN